MTFYLKNFLLQLQCSLFHRTSITLHYGLVLVISPSTPKKYMIISYKSLSLFSDSLSPLSLNGFQLKRINSINYFGIIISSSLSLSSHVQSVCSKVRHNIGIIYHNFYQHASLQTLSHCITLMSFPISPIGVLSGTHQYL